MGQRNLIQAGQTGRQENNFMRNLILTSFLEDWRLLLEPERPFMEVQEENQNIFEQ
jgi:hypothetical protein